MRILDENSVMETPLNSKNLELLQKLLTAEIPADAWEWVTMAADGWKRTKRRLLSAHSSLIIPLGIVSLVINPSCPYWVLGDIGPIKDQ